MLNVALLWPLLISQTLGALKATSKADVLLHQSVILDKDSYVVHIERPSQQAFEDLTLRFIDGQGKDVVIFQFSEVNSSFAAEPLKLAPSLPPTVMIEASGGTDGAFYYFVYLYSLVDGKFAKTFEGRYSYDTYHYEGTCGELEASKNGLLQLDVQNNYTVQRSMLNWDKQKNAFIATKPQHIPVYVTAIKATDVYDVASRHKKPVQKLAKDRRVELLQVKFCSAKLDGDLCKSDIPMEQLRWFQIKSAGKKYWLWEADTFATELVCNFTNL